MTLDLGQKTTLTCRACGMSYAPAQREDAALHARFHARAVAEGGGAVTPRIWPVIARALVAENKVWGTSSKALIVCVRGADAPAKRRAAAGCLRVAEKELGAVEVESEDLWRRVELKAGGGEGDAFCVFMCLSGHACVGLLLAERIETARVAQSHADGTPGADESEPAHEEGPVFAGEVEHSAVLGIARIWTAKTARRSGVALTLLEQARQHFLPDGAVAMEGIAFSQPTQMGAGLARRFFGKRWGWLVYTG
jgi:N-acetyltransferase